MRLLLALALATAAAGCTRRTRAAYTPALVVEGLAVRSAAGARARTRDGWTGEVRAVLAWRPRGAARAPAPSPEPPRDVWSAGAAQHRCRAPAACAWAAREVRRALERWGARSP